ncbi:unnamed protein product [Trichogramma brassicae]|uniref:Uncharacterized protein n=1 Tax=Trichogramma brassicae TaxID=86971 RepID=A0A6H5INW9_9HYME|nr:unnamed protein product [Trichogramma brassicae]
MSVAMRVGHAPLGSARRTSRPTAPAGSAARRSRLLICCESHTPSVFAPRREASTHTTRTVGHAELRGSAPYLSLAGIGATSPPRLKRRPPLQPPSRAVRAALYKPARRAATRIRSWALALSTSPGPSGEVRHSYLESPRPKRRVLSRDPGSNTNHSDFQSKSCWLDRDKSFNKDLFISPQNNSLFIICFLPNFSHPLYITKLHQWPLGGAPAPTSHVWPPAIKYRPLRASFIRLRSLSECSLDLPAATRQQGRLGTVNVLEITRSTVSPANLCLADHRTSSSDLDLPDHFACPATEWNSDTSHQSRSFSGPQNVAFKKSSKLMSFDANRLVGFGVQTLKLFRFRPSSGPLFEKSSDFVKIRRKPSLQVFPLSWGRQVYEVTRWQAIRTLDHTSEQETRLDLPTVLLSAIVDQTKHHRT